MSSPRSHRAAPIAALLTLLILGLVAVVALAGAAFGQSAPSIRLSGGVDDGAYFSVNPGFNVVGVQVAAGAGSPVQRFTARADGDGSNTVFDLTDALAVTFEGDILVSDEVPTIVADSQNRRFTSRKAVGDSGIADPNAGHDGYVASEDIVVSVNGVVLTSGEYGTLPDSETGLLTVLVQTDPGPSPGDEVRFTYETPIFDIHDPGATPISSLVSATDNLGGTYIAQSIDPALGVLTLDSALLRASATS